MKKAILFIVVLFSIITTFPQATVNSKPNTGKNESALPANVEAGKVFKVVQLVQNVCLSAGYGGSVGCICLDCRCYCITFSWVNGQITQVYSVIELTSGCSNSCNGTTCNYRSAYDQMIAYAEEHGDEGTLVKLTGVKLNELKNSKGNLVPVKKISVRK